MPRQKFCSVPGCLSTTDVIKREQETFLSAYCQRCSTQRPCRCPAPDIYTTRRETRTKFASWCTAIGLRSPGYYINVCYKHFSAGCPSRACPNPDVVKPAWEKHIKVGSTGSKIDDTNKVHKRRRRRKSSSSSSNPSKSLKIESSVMTTTSGSNNNRTSSLLRDALLLPPKSSSANTGNQKRMIIRQASTSSTSSTATDLQSLTPSSNPINRQVIVMLTPTSYSALPTSIALPQTPVPLSQLNVAAVSNSPSITTTVCSSSRSTVTPPSSSNSSLGTKDDDDEESDFMEGLMNIDDRMLLEMLDTKKGEDLVMHPMTAATLSFPLLDQSDDPYLNEGDESLSFVSEELDETVQKWMENCNSTTEANFLPI